MAKAELHLHIPADGSRIDIVRADGFDFFNKSMTIKVNDRMETRIKNYMQRFGIHTRSEALREILDKGLNTEGM